MARAADVLSPFTACLMLPLGGAFARVPDGDTPLAHRDAKWNYHVLAQWEDPADAERNIEWTRSFDATMGEYAERGIYVNFVAEPSAAAIEGAFGRGEVRPGGGGQGGVRPGQRLPEQHEHPAPGVAARALGTRGPLGGLAPAGPLPRDRRMVGCAESQLRCGSKAHAVRVASAKPRRNGVGP